MDLHKIKNSFIVQKFRFDLGISFLSLINFGLLIITASDKINKIIPLNTWQLLLVLIPLAFVGMWLFGFFLDKVVKYFDTMRNVQSKRDPMFMEVYDAVKRIEKKLEK